VFDVSMLKLRYGCTLINLQSSLSSFRETLLIRLANVSGAYDIDGISDVCETLDCIANVYRVKGENQKALQFFQQCLKRRLRLLSITSSDETLVSLLLQTYEEVVMLTKLQAKECENDSEKLNEIGKLLAEMGSLYDHRLNKKSKALIYYQRALQLFEQAKDYKQVSNTLLLIGMIHVKKLDNQEAYKCFQDSLVKRRVYSKEKDTAEIAETMHNIGNCEAKDGRFDESLRSFEEALRIKNQICPNEGLSIAKTEHCMGLVMLQLGNLDAALGFFEKSLKVRRALLSNDHLDISFSLHR
jgi:tetratricopeptide (TPR) repeat protein